ncbi:hypothetical protein [Archaeoglobus sp.]
MRFTIEVDDEFGKRFRKTVVEVKGNKKGAVKEAIKEAIELWLSKYEKRE